MLKNKNINSFILGFLPIKDIASLEQVNKSLNKSCKQFNYKWKDSCENRFLQISEIRPLNTDENKYLQEVQDKINKSSCFDYKKIYERGIKIYLDWGNDNDSNLLNKQDSSKGTNFGEFLLKKNNYKINKISNTSSSTTENSKVIKDNEDEIEQEIANDLLSFRNEIFEVYKSK